MGGSAGGIFVGRAITDRPELFGAAVDQVPVLGHGAREITANGVPNIPEFGTVKTEEGFKALYAMSPYHRVKDGMKYPAVLLTTGINDPRVDAWEAARWRRAAGSDDQRQAGPAAHRLRRGPRHRLDQEGGSTRSAPTPSRSCSGRPASKASNLEVGRHLLAIRTVELD